MTLLPNVESPEYLQCLVLCNKALSKCLKVPLDAKNGAAKYEYASKTLATPERWPDDVLVRAESYSKEWPWLTQTFAQKKPGARCPVWEQVARDLLKSEKVLDHLARRLRSWSHDRRTKSTGTKSTQSTAPRAKAAEEFGYVVWELVRIIIGKAKEWLARWKAKVKAKKVKDGESWLDIALYYCNGDIQRPVRELETGTKRTPARDTTRAKADPVPLGDQGMAKRKVSLQSDLPQYETDALFIGTPTPPENNRPDYQAIRKETADLLVLEVQRLPAIERQVVILKVFLGCDWPEIAATTRCSVEEAKAHWESAINLLRRRLPGDFTR